eukprot:9504057-Pyramimonas_sp.AAC.2
MTPSQSPVSAAMPNGMQLPCHVRRRRSKGTMPRIEQPSSRRAAAPRCAAGLAGEGGDRERSELGLPAATRAASERRLRARQTAATLSSMPAPANKSNAPSNELSR